MVQQSNTGKPTRSQVTKLIHMILFLLT